jgi:hypothetical protein
MTDLNSSDPLYVHSRMQQKGATASLPPSLFEPRAKCSWAKKHLDTLKMAIDVFRNENPYKTESEVDPESSQYIIKITHPNIVNAIPAVMMLGDFAETLRASLDYIAWQLALLSGIWPRRETSFPIVEKYTFDAHQLFAKTTFGIPDGAVAVMKTLQPYHSGDAYLSHHLYRLSNLCNVDKHRHISVYSVIPDWQWCLQGYGGGGQMLTEQVENCTIMRLPLSAKNHVKFNPDCGIALKFSIQPKMDSSERFDLSYQDLVEMHDFVAQTVIPAFTSFFPDTEIPGKPNEVRFW